jgi:hypothetical protein
LFRIVTGTAQKVGLVIGGFAARTVRGVGSLFRFEFLGGKEVVYIFEEEFVTMSRIACGSPEIAELNGVECGVVPVVNVPTFLEELGS